MAEPGLLNKSTLLVNKKKTSHVAIVNNIYKLLSNQHNKAKTKISKDINKKNYINENLKKLSSCLLFTHIMNCECLMENTINWVSL